jgi:acetamidase/formamidase
MAIATVSTGETVVIQTDDAFGSQVHSEADLPSTVNKWPYVNPQTGPTLIEGARAGDTLRVEILSIEPARDYVVSAFIPGLGGLVPSDNTPMLSKDLDEKVFIYRLDEDGVHFSENIVLPYAPFLGTIATAPELEAVSTISPGDFGGNMDVPDIGPGALIRLPISVDGAFFFIGDAHAAQGDGELCGAACEMPARVRLRFELEPGQAIPLPEIETEQEVMVVGSARPLEDAVRRASSYLVELMVARYGFDSATAYQLLTHAGRLRVGNIVNPRYSVAARIAKAFLPPRRAGVARLGEVTSG